VVLGKDVQCGGTQTGVDLDTRSVVSSSILWHRDLVEVEGTGQQTVGPSLEVVVRVTHHATESRARNGLHASSNRSLHSHLLEGVKHGHVRAGRDLEVDDNVTLKKSVRSSLTSAHACDPLSGDAQRVQHPVQDRGEPTVVSRVNSKLNKWSHLQNNRKNRVSRLFLIR
jgi:hypothetical protein